MSVGSNPELFAGALPRSVISLENCRHPLNQSDPKQKPIVTWSPSFPLLLLVCRLLLWRKTFVTIGCRHYSDFRFTTVNLKMLYHLIYRKPCIGSLIIFNPNTSVHFLHTVLYTFPIVLTRRICLTIKSFFS